MKQSVRHHLVASWERLRRDGALPHRRDLDMADLRPWLDWLVMVDFDGAPAFPIKIAGGGLNALFGRQLRGRSFASLWALADRQDLADILASSIMAECPVAMPVHARVSDRPELELELLILPFAGGDNGRGRALCAISPDILPSWIGLIPASHLTFEAGATPNLQKSEQGRASALTPAL